MFSSVCSFHESDREAAYRWRSRVIDFGPIARVQLVILKAVAQAMDNESFLFIVLIVVLQSNLRNPIEIQWNLIIVPCANEHSIHK